MAKINWNKRPSHMRLLDVGVGETFKHNGPGSKGAVYMKCEDIHGEHFGLELATGKLFPLIRNGNSDVSLVDVEINISVEKPLIY